MTGILVKPFQFKISFTLLLATINPKSDLQNTFLNIWNTYRMSLLPLLFLKPRSSKWCFISDWKHVVSPDVQTQSLPKGLQLQVDSSMAMYKYTHRIPNLKLEHRLWSA